MPGASGHEQVRRGAVELVRAVDNRAAILQRAEIDRAGYEPRVRDDVAQNAQARHATVGIDREPYVRPATDTLHLEAVGRVALQRGPHEHRLPVGCEHLVDGRMATQLGALE